MGPMINGARFVLLEPGTGLVLSQRGPDGGFSLARPASDISLAEIVDGSARSDGRSRGGQGWLQTGHKPRPQAATGGHSRAPSRCGLDVHRPLLLGRCVAEPAQVELYPVAVDDHDDAGAFGAGGHQVVVQGGQQHVIAVF
jgi:hypothetical protein